VAEPKKRLVTFVYQLETDGEILLNTVYDSEAESFERKLKTQGLTHHCYAIISGAVLKSFNSAGGYHT